LINVLKIKTDVKGLDVLDNYIIIVEKFAQSKYDVEFQKFLQEKALETVNRIARQRIQNTTNDEYIEEYILRNSIREEADGFVIYNNFTIPAILVTKNTKNQDRDSGLVRNYDDGFNLALAFEYGVGIVGQDNPVNGAWDYNINNYGKGGWYYKTPSGDVLQTEGYKGAEVYRFAAEEIQNNLGKWTMEYFDRKR